MEEPAAVPSAKAALRGEMIERRNRLAAGIRAKASGEVARRAIAFIADLRPHCIAAYLPIGSECDPGAVIAWAADNGIAVALPAVVDKTTMVFRRYRPGDRLDDGGFGTRAPGADAPRLDPDLIVAPMIAYDRTGGRLGYGLGFYDRAIAELRARGLAPLMVGAAFAVQEIARIPRAAHDAHLDAIVTEIETVDLRQTDRGA